MDIITKFYNNNIQMDQSIIKEISLICSGKKMLVFGLGYDSELWYNLTNFNTYFVEHDDKYIDLNKNIARDHIIKYLYPTTVRKSFTMTDKEIDSISIPEELLKLAPFDIILIDGPPGYDDERQGRLLPIYWVKKYLSKKGTIVYIDDSNRGLETFCINKYFSNDNKEIIKVRDGCARIKL